MKTEIELVTTGSELLNGRTVNRHAQVLGDQLAPLGLHLVRDTTVPDDIDAIRETVAAALRRADIVIVTGGLGPTSDDVTREAIAQWLNRKLVMNEVARQAIRRRYERTRRVLNPAVERHALVIEGAAVLPSSAGLAPGERLDLDGKVLFILPGPPREFAAMLSHHVLPWLKKAFAGTPEYHVLLFQVCGLGESDIVTRMASQSFPAPGVEAAYCASPGRVEVRLAAWEKDTGALETSVRALREALGDFIFADERIELEHVIGRLLREKKATLATAESCTGGLIGHRITSISGSSDYYLGGTIAYSNEVKIADLGVTRETLDQHGAVSAEVAGQMAEGVRRRFNADYGLSITGIAGPSGGTPEKPVGLVFIALADAAGRQVKEHRFAGGRDVIKDWSAQMALDMLRRRLLGIP